MSTQDLRGIARELVADLVDGALFSFDGLLAPVEAAADRINRLPEVVAPDVLRVMVQDLAVFVARLIGAEAADDESVNAHARWRALLEDLPPSKGANE